MAHIILPNALPNLNYSINIFKENVLNSEEKCAERHELDFIDYHTKKFQKK